MIKGAWGKKLSKPRMIVRFLISRGFPSFNKLVHVSFKFLAHAQLRMEWMETTKASLTHFQDISD